MGDRVILHSDINCCYASIEHLHHPELAGKPLAVGGDPEARHGIVLTADYIAKKYGVKTGMALWQAKQVCPDITFVSPRMDLYLRFSRMAHEIYAEYTDRQEPYGIDECWLDVTGSSSLKGDGLLIAQEISRRMKSELGITVSSLIVLACSLVIYSLFYISVIGKTHEYGRLRVLGATSVQIKRIVRKESFLLSCAAIPIGVVLGSVLGYCFVPDGWHWMTTLECAVVIALVTEIALKIAVHTPVKKASMVSPIEALRINTTDTPATEKTRIEHRKITPSSLARMSFARNKKKAILTVLSLGFAGVLLMCAATYLNSTDVESMAKQQFANGDIVLSLDPANTNAEDRPAGINALQTKNPLDEVLEETISDMDGVKNIEFIQGCVSNMEFPTPFKDGNSHFFTQIGIPENQYEAFSQGLIEGTADRQKLINGKGVIVDNSAKLLSDYYNYTPQIGDIVKVETADGQWEEFTVRSRADK